MENRTFYFLSAGLLFFLCLFQLSPFFSNSGFPDDEHNYDIEVHAYRAWFVGQNLLHNFQYPLWTSDWYLGMPFIESYQLAALVFSPIYMLFEPIFATKVMLLFNHFLTVLFFFIFAFAVFKDKKLAIAASVLFSFFPYVLFKVAHQGAMAEASALMIVPLLFLFMFKWRETKKIIWLAFAALVIALSFFANASSGVFFCMAALVYMLIVFIRERKIYFSTAILILGALVPVAFLAISLITMNEASYAVTPDSLFGPINVEQMLVRVCTSTVSCAWHGNARYIGIALLAGVLCSLLFGKKTRIFALTGVAMLLIGIFSDILFPMELKKTIAFADRLYIIITVMFALAAIEGFFEVSKRIAKKLEFENFAGVTIAHVILAFFALFLIWEYWVDLPTGKPLAVPDGVYKFYGKISSEREYFRVEDQAFFTFGFSPALHKHGVLNGGFMQLASKYHFTVWSLSHKLPETENGKNNYAKLYGSSSVKYMIIGGKMGQLPFWKELECGAGYCVYENGAFLPKVRLVNAIASISNPNDADAKVAVLQVLSERPWDFSQAVFARSNETFPQASKLGALSIQSEKPGHYKLELSGITEQQYVYVGESYYSGWVARLNGREIPILESLPSAIVIPVSESGTLELDYSPGSKSPVFLASLAVSILSFLGLFAIIFFNWKQMGGGNGEIKPGGDATEQKAASPGPGK